MSASPVGSSLLTLRRLGAYHVIASRALTQAQLAAAAGKVLPTLLPGHTLTPQVFWAGW